MRTGSFNSSRAVLRSGSMHSPSCPSKKVNDYLTVDCSECDGPQDIEQLRCLRGCVRAISEAGEIDHISLARDVVIEYRGRSVIALRKMSIPLASHRIDAEKISRRCARCPIEPSGLVDQILSAWPPMPQRELFMMPSHRCNGIECASCRNRTLAIIEAMRRDLSALNIQLDRLGVKVLGVSH